MGLGVAGGQMSADQRLTHPGMMKAVLFTQSGEVRENLR
uniref:Uncharacterized protein n=1 Tax=Pseudomonas fluorescens (strain SBW25) TaxID=216595 RepID=A0A0G4E5G1_PSEFS|nr:hypothetical protein PQBR57_0305 [Pseudomonas fluorescens SBW25]